MKSYTFWLFLCLSIYFSKAVDLSAKNSLIWGPGLERKIVLPARYFFIQAVDKENNK